MTTSPAFERLSRHWQATAAEVVVAPPDETAVADLEGRLGLRLPSDFRDYLIFGLPQSQSDAMDVAGTEWWVIGRIKTLADEYQSTIRNPEVLGRERDYVVFADAMIWCWAWAIDCGRSAHRGRIIVVGRGDDRFVADSFDAFVDLYIADDQQLA